jgi:hypothetical protein
MGGFCRPLAAISGTLFPHLPERTAFHKRRLRLSGVIAALIREFARHSAGSPQRDPAHRPRRCARGLRAE